MPQVLTHDVWMYRDPTLPTSLSKQELVGYEVQSTGLWARVGDGPAWTRTSLLLGMFFPLRQHRDSTTRGRCACFRP